MVGSGGMWGSMVGPSEGGFERSVSAGTVLVDAPLDSRACSSLRTNVEKLFRDDELLAVLRQDPRTVRHAEARAKEILDSVAGMDRRAQEKRMGVRLAERDAEVARLRSQAEKLRQELEGMRNEKLIAEQRLSRVSARAEDAERKHSTAQEQLERQAADLASATRAVAEMKETTAAAEGRASSLDAELSAIQQRVAREIDGREEKIQSLGRTLEEVRAQASRQGLASAHRETELLAEVARIGRLLDAEEKKSQAARIETEDQRAQMQEMRTANAEADSQNQQLRRALEEAEELLEESEAGRQELTARYVALGERMDAARAEEDDARRIADEDAEAARLALQDAVRDLESLVEQRSDLRDQVRLVWYGVVYLSPGRLSPVQVEDLPACPC